MRSRAQQSLWLAVALVPLMLLAGSSDDKTEVNDGMDVYFRTTDPLALGDQSLPEYPKTPAGESKRLGRDFPDAPPQVPHTVEDNECLECHHPENAGKGDVPLPKSHFRAPVMGKGDKGDAMVWVVKHYKQMDDVVGARWNCSMCHTPQATNVQTPSSAFVPAKKKKDAAKKQMKK